MVADTNPAVCGPNVACEAIVEGANIVQDVGAAIEEKAAASADFAVGRNGTAYPVPKGATGPVPNVNNAGNVTGVQFTGGSGGANGQVSTIRLMNPNQSNPSGYVRYNNALNQGGNPYTGQTVPTAKDIFHSSKA